MTRFLSRDEWPLVMAGILAGVLTSALLIYLFVTGLGGSPPPRLNGDSDTTSVLTRGDREQRAAERARSRAGPLIGAREQSIRTRLARFPVNARPLRGPLRITARNVVWNEDGGARFARADVITASLSAAAIQSGDVILDDVVVRQPVVALREAGGAWNFEQVFEELLDGGENGDVDPAPTRTIRLRNVRIDNGTVNVTRPEQRFAFLDLEATLPLVVLSAPGVPDPYLRAAAVSARFVQDEPQADLALVVRDGEFVFPSGTVRFDIDAASLDETRVADLEGVWNPADPGYGITVTGRALEVDLANVAFALPEALPRSGNASFGFSVRPAAGDRTEVAFSDLDARSGDSRVLGAVEMRVGEEYFELLSADLRVDPLALELVEGFTGELPYGGGLTGTIRGSGGNITFDLTARLTTEAVPDPFNTGLTGRVRYTDAGLVIQQVDVALNRVPLAALRAFAPSLPLGGTVTGTVALRGPPNRAPLDLDVRLELGTGVAVVEGTLDLTGAVARYDLTGRLIGVDLQSVMQPSAPPVSLTANFALAGTGFDPAVMDARVRLDGRFTGWESTPRDEITFAATVRDGTLAVDTLYGSLATADLQASGTWRFLEPQSGAVTYRTDITSLRPFGPYIPVLGDSVAAGSLRAAGTVSGTLDRLRLAGEASGTGVRVGGWRAQSVSGTHDLVIGGGRLPTAIVNASARDVVTPTTGNYSEGTLALRMAPPGLDFDVNATRADGGLVEIAAHGVLPETGQREIVIERARFDLANDRWVLLGPAEVRWTGGGPAFVDGLQLEAERSEGRIAIDGAVFPLADMNATLEIAAMPVGDIQRLLGRPVRVDGLLWASGSVRGGADSRVDLSFRVDGGAVEGIPLQRLEGTLLYAGQQTQLDAHIVVDSAGRLDIDATLPSRLSLADSVGFELVDGIPLSGTITAERFALAPLAAAVPQVQDLVGFVDAEVTLGGTADSPQVEGSLTLEGGNFRVASLNQRFTDAAGSVAFDGRRLVINELRVRSEGWMTIGGQIVLERLTEPVLDLKIAFDAFEPMGVTNHPDAAVWGEVVLTGPPDGLLLTGAIEVADGYIVVPELGRPALRPELVDMTRPAAFDTIQFEPVESTDIFGNLRIRNLVVDLSNDTWFLAYQAQAQLSGTLIVNKNGDSTPITGTLSGNRGQYTLLAGPVVRRFDIVSATVRFRGEPEPNPSIDITARRIVLDPNGRQLDVDVRITGTAETPTIQLAGGTTGQIAESELLSFLLFGAPSSTLAGEGRLPGDQLLSQTYFGGALELLSLELERSLGGLGLDILQVSFGQGTFGIEAPTIVAGKQILPDVFLTLEAALNGLFGEETDVTTLAIRLDWTFDRRSRLRLALEPVYRGRGLRSSVFALPLQDPQRQLLIELRRRWTY